MLKKQGIEKRIEDAIAIAEKYSITNMVSDLENFRIFNQNYKVHILMVGEFSAGKSALLNKLIGKEVLVENPAPETAVAAELYFSEQEVIVVKDKNGNRYQVTDIQKIHIDDVHHLEYYLNSENLKKKCDYVLVDTPGFDSGIERHNKALMQYIERGTVYFLVVDCEKGTISESALNFINEVSNYSEDIAVIINKCDKKTPKEAEEVREYISDLLSATSGREFPIICTSRNEVDVDKKLIRLIQEFQAQYYYEKEITMILNEKQETLIAALELIRDTRECDTIELDKEIQNRELVKKRLLDQVETQKRKVGTKLYREIKDKIISHIDYQLNSNVQALANAYKGGTELFQEKVVEIIRPILITEIGDYSVAAYGDFVESINFNSFCALDDLEEIGDILTNVCEKLRTLGENRNYLLPMQEPESAKFMERKGNTYRIISSALAIVTNFIAPPLELIIVFLPDIIRLIQTFLKTSREQQLVDVIRFQVIPQIVSKLQAELDKPLEQVETVIIDNIGTSINEMLDIENQALEVVKSKKNEVQQDYTGFLNEIENDIAILQR